MVKRRIFTISARSLTTSKRGFTSARRSFASSQRPLRRRAATHVTLTPDSGTIPVDATLTPRTFREWDTTDWP